MKTISGGLIVGLFALATFIDVHAQGGRGGGQAQVPPAAPRAAAPIDLTGYWVALVSEDWRWRMGVGLKGDYGYLTLNAEGRKVGNSWDPAKDEAAGEQCRSYGAIGVMRQPTRLHVTWQDDETLRIDTDAGTQTRILHFGGTAPQGQEATWQGYSIARWDPEGPRPQRGQPPPPSRDASAGLAGAFAAGGTAPRAGQLRVVTTNLRPGYIYKHGVPYGGRAVLTEYFQVVPGLQGEQYLNVTATVEDPQYWAQPFVRTVHFRREPDGSKWSPTPCSSR
jgi:hypothetical protein